MTRRSKVWFAAVVAFSVINLAGAVIAAAQGEFIHASVHVALMLLGSYYVRRMLYPVQAVITTLPVSIELTDRLNHLEQSVEAVALGIERVGEGQRFMTHFIAEHGMPVVGGDETAQLAHFEATEPAPPARRD